MSEMSKQMTTEEGFKESQDRLYRWGILLNIVGALCIVMSAPLKGWLSLALTVAGFVTVLISMRMGWVWDRRQMAQWEQEAEIKMSQITTTKP